MLLEDAGRFSSAIMLATLPVIDPVDRYAENLMKYEELLTRRTQEWLAKLPDLPIYMIHSRDDELLPYSHALRAHQALIGDDRHVELHTIEGVGHFDSEGYIEPLQASVPWLIDTWSSSKPI